MTGVLRKWMVGLAERAATESESTVEQLLVPSVGCRLLDVGCWDGVNTSRWAERTRASEVWGLEGDARAASEAEKRGIKVKVGDLDAGPWPVETETFDVVVSNQVIEHVDRVDHFLREVRRVMKPAGYAVISTENLASWHNIAALVLGWQPFSISPYSEHGSVGNPWALHREDHMFGVNGTHGWLHRRVFARRGWLEVFDLNGLRIDEEWAVGYYPFPPGIARFDLRHGHYWTAKATRAD